MYLDQSYIKKRVGLAFLRLFLGFALLPAQLRTFSLPLAKGDAGLPELYGETWMYEELGQCLEGGDEGSHTPPPAWPTPKNWMQNVCPDARLMRTSSPSTFCASCLTPPFMLHPPVYFYSCQTLKPPLYISPVACAFPTWSSLLPWHCLDCAQDSVFSLLGSGPREQPWQMWPSHCVDAASVVPGAGELSQSRGSSLSPGSNLTHKKNPSPGDLSPIPDFVCWYVCAV